MKIVVFNNTQSEQIHVQPKGSGNQAKRWELTINNYTQEDVDWVLRLEGNVICYKEVGESGTPHLQGQVVFKRNYRFPQLKKLHPRAHWVKSVCALDRNYYRKLGSILVRDDKGKRRTWPMQSRLKPLSSSSISPAPPTSSPRGDSLRKSRINVFGPPNTSAALRSSSRNPTASSSPTPQSPPASTRKIGSTLSTSVLSPITPSSTYLAVPPPHHPDLWPLPPQILSPPPGLWSIRAMWDAWHPRPDPQPFEFPYPFPDNHKLTGPWVETKLGV